jgi:hypothetical protein
VLAGLAGSVGRQADLHLGFGFSGLLRAGLLLNLVLEGPC